MSDPARGDLRRVLLARGLRAFGDGFAAILLPIHLSLLGFAPLAVGMISTAALLGSALLSLGLGLLGHRVRRRAALVAASVLMAGTGIAFAWFDGFWPLLLVGLFGTINPTSGDVGVFLPLEHTVLAQSVTDRQRTAAFARYSFTGSIVGALGALSCGLVAWFAPRFGEARVIEGFFLLYGAIGLAALLLYRGLSPRVEAATEAPPAPLGPSRRRVYGLAALFSLDAFGGGFVVTSMLSLWLSDRFGMEVATLGAVFFATGVCSAASHLVAVPVARRFGLVNTMVWTHLPSNLFLVLVPFAPDGITAVALLVARSMLSNMDVPTRSSYVMAVVTPPERPAAASFTTVPRSLAAALAPAFSGWMIGAGAFGWPLVLAGGLKIIYDLLLLRAFARIRPPEET